MISAIFLGLCLAVKITAFLQIGTFVIFFLVRMFVISDRKSR